MKGSGKPGTEFAHARNKPVGTDVWPTREVKGYPPAHFVRSGGDGIANMVRPLVYPQGESLMNLATKVTGALLVVFALTTSTRAADLGPDPKDVKEVTDKGIAFLKKSQKDDGSFSPRYGPGVTALVIAAALQSGLSPDDPFVAKALKALEKNIQSDGGIYNKMHANYTTSVSIMALAEANKDKRYDKTIKDATAFLRKLQYGDGIKDSDPNFGGVGYDAKSRPDLSNMQMFIDALVASGVPKDDPALQRALKFIGRCQNLPGESNDLPFAKKASEDDMGGMVYCPGDTESPAHKTSNGGLRSVGAMTYGGLKSFLYAGVSKKDPRVEGAVKWIKNHYTLEENPGMKQAGLYYYYHTFGKAMTALGEDQFEDAKGTKHDWRKELFDALKKRQAEDGSWTNKGDMTFGEADANLATAFALLSLHYTKPAKK